jgi:hypothetical protein
MSLNPKKRGLESEIQKKQKKSRWYKGLKYNVNPHGKTNANPLQYAATGQK